MAMRMSIGPRSFIPAAIFVFVAALAMLEAVLPVTGIHAILSSQLTFALGPAPLHVAFIDVSLDAFHVPGELALAVGKIVLAGAVPADAFAILREDVGHLAAALVGDPFHIVGKRCQWQGKQKR